uniref:Uncharacterized protein n=1 Tax=Anguilla anguilla TaxID=7936 RepID=A0A0E9UMG4_ANGAN
MLTVLFCIVLETPPYKSQRGWMETQWS